MFQESGDAHAEREGWNSQFLKSAWVSNRQSQDHQDPSSRAAHSLTSTHLCSVTGNLLCKASCHLRREGHDSLEHSSVQLSRVIPDTGPRQKTSCCSQLYPCLSRGDDLPDRRSITARGRDQHYQSNGEYKPSLTLPSAWEMPCQTFSIFILHGRASNTGYIPVFTSKLPQLSGKSLISYSVSMLPHFVITHSNALSFSATHLFHSSLLKTTVLITLPSKVNKLLKTSRQHKRS